jgi:hypothetical protein
MANQEQVLVWHPAEETPTIPGRYLVRFAEFGVLGQKYVSTAWWQQDDNAEYFWLIDWEWARKAGYTVTHYAFLEW